MAVGALEPHFFAELLARLDIDDVDVADQYDQGRWPGLRARLADAFAGRRQAEWVDVFGSGDACVSPVVPWTEAAVHPQMHARRAIVEVEGEPQPAPAPAFSRTPAAAPRPGWASDAEVLASWGLDSDLIAALSR